MERSRTDGAELEYEVSGVGEPVIFIHGAFIADTFRPLQAEPSLAYSRERLLRRGVERNLQIIGEAVGRLRRDDPKTADRLSEHEKIVGSATCSSTVTTWWTTGSCGTP